MPAPIFKQAFRRGFLMFPTCRNVSEDPACGLMGTARSLTRAPSRLPSQLYGVTHLNRLLVCRQDKRISSGSMRLCALLATSWR